MRVTIGSGTSSRIAQRAPSAVRVTLSREDGRGSPGSLRAWLRPWAS